MVCIHKICLGCWHHICLTKSDSLSLETNFVGTNTQSGVCFCFSPTGFLDKNNDLLNRNLIEVSYSQPESGHSLLKCEFEIKQRPACGCVLWFGFCSGHVPVWQSDREAVFLQRGSGRPETPRDGEASPSPLPIPYFPFFSLMKKKQKK